MTKCMCGWMGGWRMDGFLSCFVPFCVCVYACLPSCVWCGVCRAVSRLSVLEGQWDGSMNAEMYCLRACVSPATHSSLPAHSLLSGRLSTSGSLSVCLSVGLFLCTVGSYRCPCDEMHRHNVHMAYIQTDRQTPDRQVAVEWSQEANIKTHCICFSVLA